MIFHDLFLEFVQYLFGILNDLRFDGRDRKCIGIDKGLDHVLAIVAGVRKASN